MALFKRSAAEIFSDKDHKDADMPEYRVAAWASYDLKQHMREHPFTIIFPEDVVWNVSKVEEDVYEAEGVIKLPVQIRLRIDPESGELVKQRVVLNGEKRYDIRDEVDKAFDPLDSVNVDEARVQAYTRYRHNIGE